MFGEKSLTSYVVRWLESRKITGGKLFVKYYVALVRILSGTVLTKY
jgi:hypothetical protein